MNKSIYMSFCTDCAEIVRQTRTMVESSSAYVGVCRGCFGFMSVQQYEVGPTHEELRRKRAREKAAAAKGGGERARAGRRRA